MEPVAAFMQRYFEAHIAEEQREQLSLGDFRRRFFGDECPWANRAGKLEILRSEKVASVSNREQEAEVTTTREIGDGSGAAYDMRYHLRAVGESWLIRDVDLRCCSCFGEAPKETCPCCHGTGWRSTNRELQNAGKCEAAKRN